MDRPVAGHSVNPFLFGTGSWVYGQIRGLARWRAVVVCKRRENQDQFPFDAVHARDDLGPLARLRERLGRRARGYFPMHREVLARAGARLLHSHFGSQGWNDVPLAGALGVPLATSLYGADVWRLSRDPLWLHRYRELFDAGALFLVEGNAMRRRILGMGCAPRKIAVQHLGVELRGTPFQERRPAAGGTVRVLASGRAVEKKGHELAVRAFARARARVSGLHLSLMVIATSTEERGRLDALRRLVREEGLDGAIDFPPPMPYEAYRRALYGYHLFLAPSLHASDGDAEGGAPVSLIDMSATGMPIAASRHCDIPEVVLDGKSGLLFAENDVEAAADALSTLAAQPERWAEMGRAGREHVEREYGLERQVQRLEAIYDSVATGLPSSAPSGATAP